MPSCDLELVEVRRGQGQEVAPFSCLFSSSSSNVLFCGQLSVLSIAEPLKPPRYKVSQVQFGVYLKPVSHLGKLKLYFVPTNPVRHP